MQMGILSQFFYILRGWCQGDPIAPYLFILCANVLLYLIYSNKNIKGIIIDGTEFKINQFADDTTLLLDGSRDSLQAALNTLEIYGNISGLRVNTDKN